MRYKKGIILALLTVSLSSLLFTACSNSNEQPQSSNNANTEANSSGDSSTEYQQFQGKYVISAQDAVNKIGAENVIFVDARGPETAAKGTVNGAIALMWQDLSNVSGKSGDEMWGTVLPADELVGVLGNIGLDPQKEIILFADANKGWGNDGRILWNLRIAGYDKLFMVDGGIDALSGSGAELVKTVNKIKPVSVIVSNMNYDACINTDELVVNYDNYKIIDTRAKAEYEGATKYGETKGGHLPGAINIDYVDLFEANGNLKSKDEITKMFEEKGISKSDSIVTYCTAGIRSAYAQVVLEMCGFENVKNYDESFYRWSAVNEVE